MRVRRFVHPLLSLLVSISLLLTSFTPMAQATPPAQEPLTAAAVRPVAAGDAALYRTRITIDSQARRQRLDELGVVILAEDKPTTSPAAADNTPWTAIVLADDEQLETLARLRYEPQASDEFIALVQTNTAANAWLSAGLTPLMTQAATLAEISSLSPALEGRQARAVDARAMLRTTANALTREQRTALADLTSLDDDADGLTNAQEAWWCTDPLNADTDGDGASEGDEVQAAKDWLGNRRAGPPSTGRPFAGWPPTEFDPTKPPTCRDGDDDGVPDMAERWDLGLNMNEESTDRDKFDDGQELFGTTEWGRGALPRVTDDAGYIFAEMPTWVKAPGNHPFVAAFPVPEIDIVPSSLKVETVTTVTTDHVISEGTEKSYSTAKTEGTSTSVADTVTWNEWEEVSTTRPIGNVSARSVAEFETDFELEMDGQIKGNATGQNCMSGAAAAGVGLIGGGGSAAGCINANFTNQGDMEVYGMKSFLSAESIELPDFSFELPDFNLSDIKLDLCLFNCNKDAADQGNNTYGSQSYNGLQTPNAQQNLSQNQTAIGDQQRSIANSSMGYSIQRLSDAVFQMATQKNLQVAYPQKPTRTESKGKSWGGAQTTTSSQYEEHTVTNGEAFSNGESWGTATAENSAHAADFWFSYKIRNKGTEYARQIGNLAFNLYIGDDPDPAYTYFVAPDLGGDGIFQNFMPTEEHTYTSRRIPLSLEQMKTIDLGGALRIVVEDFTYGVDELFYQQAANAGVLIALEDGTDDGDERIDSYLLPTWGDESVVDVLARYFPHTVDENGTVIAIWTPEYRSDTPSWCAEPQVVGVGGQRTLWCKHALSTADWWNVYTNGLGDGSEGFQDTPAAPGAVALFRFNKDSDLDGYSDRSEDRLGTDPNDAGDFPRPELLAGLHSIRNSNYVTATLSLLNTGLYDAYGVEAVMIAPDDSVSITNNTVGGSGRVRAQKQVIVGSRIAAQTPLPTAWTQAGHAVPAAGGYYTGAEDRAYAFTVSCTDGGSCAVGSGAWTVNWADNKGITGTLSYDAGYDAPTFLSVGAFGLTLALHSGTVANGESFTVDARTPRDTFQYTINREPYSEPLIIVSYNDPQGNHRFIVPPSTSALTTPSDNLAPFGGEMLEDVGMEIVTTEEYTGGATSTRLLVNNPSEITLTGAHVFLEFINISGTVVSEVSTQVTLPPGPTTAEIAWDSNTFDPAYRADEDYIVMAFLTDYEGNILDTAGRPLSSFQDDPRPAAALDNGAQVWDFGTAQQGTLLAHPFALASVGYLDLLAYLGNAPGLSVDGPAAATISPGDVALYTVQLNTEALPVGAYEATIPVRTSDPQNPAASLTIRGNITAMPADAPGGAVIRPLDVDAVITGDHSQGEWVEFTHNLGPDPQTLHPVKVYSQDYGTLWGSGKYATDFVSGAASYEMFGDGRDGDLTIGPGQSFIVNTEHASVSATGTTAYPADSTGFDVGDVVIFHQTQGTSNAGIWEFNKIAAINSSTEWTLAQPLSHSYSNSNGKAQVLRVPQFRNVVIESGGTMMAPGWDGYSGGILVFFAQQMVNAGLISMKGGNGTVITTGNGQHALAPGGTGGGFRGGYGLATNGRPAYGHQGEGTLGYGTEATTPNGNGGGAGALPSGNGGGFGGGGGNSNSGGSGGPYAEGRGGDGGLSAGSSDMSLMVFGGGGGGGEKDTNAGVNPVGSGGAGGGIILIQSRSLLVSGSMTSNGGNAGNTEVDGGGGAGGSILLRGDIIDLGVDGVHATGGAGYGGGAGGAGRIRVEYCTSLSGSTVPPASALELSCFIAEQVEADPYATARLNLPETTPEGTSYKVQYGRRLSIESSVDATTALRLPKQLYSAATLDMMVGNVASATADYALSLDFGNDGTPDWIHTTATTFPATLNVTGTVSALNAYLVSRTDIAWGADVDVPVRVVSDRAADVILTNLVLRLQVNQPTARAAEVEIAADRPLDWPLSINGNYSQGTPYDFDHTLGPDAATLHPCLVYDQSGKILKGTGKYCTDLGQGTASYEMFGDGRDGVMPSSGNLDNNNGFAAGSVSGTIGSTSISVTDRWAISRVNPGDVVLIHQTRGSGAGQWEFNKAAADFTGSGTFALQKPLQYSYVSNGGNEKAQILRVPQYSTCSVTGTVTPLAAWNGDWGGIFAALCSETASISGNINADGMGFRNSGAGGIADRVPGGLTSGQQGEGSYGSGIITIAANGNGGGGGSTPGDGSGGGGGGGNASAGNNGANGQATGGRGGFPQGNSTLSIMVFGGEGGGAGGENNGSYGGGSGGNGGGNVILFARDLVINGSVTSNGHNGQSAIPSLSTNVDGAGGGGGGAGGNILLRVKTASIGLNQISVAGGNGGSHLPTSGSGGDGGSGSVGRIRIEYCNSLEGTSSLTSSEQLDCYVAEQQETTPYTTRLYLPDAVSSSQSYLVQYARLFAFASSGEQTSSLRLNRRVYGAADLDLLVTNTGAASGNLSVCLDFGDDGVCDYTHNAVTDFPATLEVSGLAEALNNYLLNRNDVAWGDPVDVPVRLSVDRAADVMLTNLALTPLGAKTRFVRLEARTYQTATLGLEFRQPGVDSGPLAFTVDVGADGVVDWSYAGTPNFPARPASPNLATALNSYLAGRSGMVDVPFRIVPSPFLDLSLIDFDATPSDQPDVVAGTPSTASEVIEGSSVALTSLVQNTGPADSGPLAVSFFASRPSPPASYYIGTAFVSNVPNNGSAPATIQWNTLGFPGDVSVQAVVDPFNRTAESNETNNSAAAPIRIRTRPDLHVTAVDLSNPLLMAGETVTVTLTLSNTGETAAGAQRIALFDANPDDGGVLVGAQPDLSLAGATATTVQFQWTPSAPGLYRLFSVSDQENAVDEYDEGNNRTWQDVYVGLAAPVLLDSGPGEPVYSTATGYGVVDEGQPDAFVTCGSGVTPEETQRLDFDGKLRYRFDHLLPGRFYHLDVTLYECTGAGRQESIYIDGNLVDGPVNLGDGEIHRRSILIDPALYADHSVDVTIEVPGVNGAIASAVNLYAVDYRYADSGGANDPDYSTELGYGAQNGVRSASWGRLPYQSVRVNQTGRNVTYRYDNLVPGRNYQLHLSFYQSGDTNRVQQVEIDGKLVGSEVTLVNGEKQRISLAVPPDSYADDGSISVSVVRTNADVGAIVNEIALEEQTVPSSVCNAVSTPYWTQAYGSVTVAGVPAPPGTVVTAENPDGVIVGCFQVGASGFYGFMPIFGGDSTGTPPLPGMATGQQVKFRVNGSLAVPNASLVWTNDKDIHRVDLTVTGIDSQWIRLNPGWTLFSLRVQPPVTSLESVFSSIQGAYCQVHSEGDIYDCALPPQVQGLTEIHGGQGYYLRNESSATVNLLVQGTPITPTLPIPLHTDWNWIGYLLQENVAVGDALAGIAGKYVRVADGKARLYNPALPEFSTLSHLTPDNGYLIFVTEPTTLAYPAVVEAATLDPLAVREVCTEAAPTPAFTWIYGDLTINGQPAPVGSRIEALTPRGELAGCFVVDREGKYGFMPIYGADGGNPPLPGFLNSEALRLRVNGQDVTLVEPLIWHNDKQEKRVDLSVNVTPEKRLFLPSVSR